MGLQSSHVGQPGVCRSCGAALVWLETVHGKWLPLDVGPADDGNVVLSSAGKAMVLSPAAAEQARQTGAKRYRTHFASCPNAKDWRRR
jgi:hypothetical protein